jgi:hypothetical protein
MNLNEALNLYNGCILLHKKLTNADGTPQRWRVNGKVHTWKTMPWRLQIPIKRGLYQFSYLTENNIQEFEVRGNEY